tara:strand:- start:166 stop:300 length:135 start_codon:yes stop_codon:yes gene_type:complete
MRIAKYYIAHRHLKEIYNSKKNIPKLKNRYEKKFPKKIGGIDWR